MLDLFVLIFIIGAWLLFGGGDEEKKKRRQALREKIQEHVRRIQEEARRQQQGNAPATGAAGTRETLPPGETLPRRPEPGRQPLWQDLTTAERGIESPDCQQKRYEENVRDKVQAEISPQEPPPLPTARKTKFSRNNTQAKLRRLLREDTRTLFLFRELIDKPVGLRETRWQPAREPVEYAPGSE